MERRLKKSGDCFWLCQNMLPEVGERLKDIVAMNSDAPRGVMNFNGTTAKKGTDNFCQVFWEIFGYFFECSCFTTGVS